MEFRFNKIQRLLTPKIKQVSILTNTSSNYYNIDLDVLLCIIEFLLKQKLKKITIYERLFKDTNYLKLEKTTKEIKNLNPEIKTYLIRNNDLQKSKVGNFNNLIFEEIYIFPEIFSADLTFILTKAYFHIHHAKKYLFSCIDELVLSCSLNNLSYENYKRKEIITILRDETPIIFEHIKKINEYKNNFYGILDGRKIKITNEHIPFFYKTKQNKIYQGQNLNNLKIKLLKSLT